MIGVKVKFPETSAELKRDAMLCDVIVTSFKPVEFYRGVSRSSDATPRLRDMDWLDSHGIVQPSSIYPGGHDAFMRGWIQYLSMSEEVMNRSPEGRGLHVDLCARLAAAELSQIADETFIPLCERPFDSTIRLSSQAPVIRAVLHALPLPDDRTPWEAVLDWRADTDAKRQFRALLRWIDDAARRKISYREACNEIATLLDDYDAYTMIHHRKLARTRFETVVLLAAEFLEDMVRFRPSTAIKRLLDLRCQEAMVADIELGAPGRALAYISGSRRKFLSGP